MTGISAPYAAERMLCRVLACAGLAMFQPVSGEYTHCAGSDLVQIRAASSSTAEWTRGLPVSEPTSDYSDLTEMIRLLKLLDEESLDFRRQREVIIERSLPLADHIARRYGGRGEPFDDLVQGCTSRLDQRRQPLRHRLWRRLPVVRRANHDGRGSPPLP
jgi:hypothetical protein